MYYKDFIASVFGKMFSLLLLVTVFGCYQRIFCVCEFFDYSERI